MHLNCVVHTLYLANSPALHLLCCDGRLCSTFLFTRSPDWTAISPALLLCGLISCIVQGCPLTRPYQNTDATGQSGRHAGRQTFCWWVAQSAECKRTHKTKQRKWTCIRISRTGWMKVRRRCRTRWHLFLRCKKRDHHKYKEVFYLTKLSIVETI